jgi:hypothetical protein
VWKYRLAVVYWVVLVGLCLWGLWLNVGRSETPLELFSYYTILSNIVVLVFFAYLLLRAARGVRAPVSPVVAGAVTMCIALTFLVFHFVLAGSLFSMGGYMGSLTNLLPHYVVPIMVIVDWLVFEPKGHLKKLDPVKWLLIPLAYVVFSLIRARFGVYSRTGSHYPYDFLDIDKYGAWQVVINSAVIGAGYALVGYVFYFIDRFIPWAGRLIRRRRELGSGPGGGGDVDRSAGGRDQAQPLGASTP